MAGDEACDGLDVGTTTCATAAGHQHGIVTCVGDCTIDTAGCHTCGNGVIEGPEACEAGDLQGETCASQGYLYGVLACGPTCAFDRSACEGYCGNGTAEPDEECDAADLHGETCATQGYVGGTLTCTGWCMRSAAGCHQCGNGAVDAGEECDGADTGGQTCATLSNGAMTGALACTAGCRLDTSTCAAPASCGNGLRETGEACDGNDLMGQTCASLNPALYGGGLLRCSTACLYDTSQCAPVEPCGNGIIEPAFGEQCEGALLGGASCQTRGFPGGTLGCTAACGFDTSACLAPLTCGNGVREGSESCDGDDLGFGTCEALGFLGGPLGCSDQCTYSTGACDTCGDGVVNGSDACDGADLGGVTCEALGYYGGTVSCAADCTRELTSCAAAGFCGDGILHAAEGEACDGQAFGADSCVGRGFDGGVLSCTSGCQVDPSTCATRGNGVCEVGETGACPEDCLIEPLAAGGQHTCYVKGDGTVWCWGYSRAGQLGNGDNNSAPPRTSPVQVRGPGGTGFFNGAISVTTGEDHSCALKSDGTMWCWGSNPYGQIGNGNTATPISYPTQVVGAGGTGFLSDVTAIAAGGTGSNFSHTCAVRSDGTLWCWGWNSTGQLGDGSNTQRTSPMQVKGPGGVGFLEGVTTHRRDRYRDRRKAHYRPAGLRFGRTGIAPARRQTEFHQVRMA
jgi:hypothetical protein